MIRKIPILFLCLLCGCQSQFQNVPAPTKPATEMASPLSYLSPESAVIPSGCIVLTNRWGRVVTNCASPPITNLTVTWPALADYGLANRPGYWFFVQTTPTLNPPTWTTIASNRAYSIKISSTNRFAALRVGFYTK